VVEVRIEGKRLDVFEGFDFSFNYGVADIRNPEKRSTEYSKTIKCPSTKSNDALFGHIYDVNISNQYDANTSNISVNFNPNKKAEARVIADGVEVMAGVVQLRKIIQKGHAYTYEVVFIGKLLNIFSVLGDKELNGLDDNGFPYIDFSDLDHNWDFGRVTSSWTNTSGYVYPMLDYGVNEPFTVQGINAWRLEQFRPALFLYEILDRIFSFSEFSYSSSFLTSAFFKRLIIPWTNEGFVVSDSEIARRETSASVQTTIDANSEFYPNYPVNSNYQDSWRVEFSQLVDPFNNWSNVNDEYTVPQDGYYVFNSQLTWETERIANEPFPVIPVAPLNNIYWVRVRFKRYQAATGQISMVSDVQHWIQGDGTYTIGATHTETFAYFLPSISLDIGDKIYMEVYAYSINPVQYQTNITGGFIQAATDADAGQITQGQTIPMNALVPSIGMTDLLLSVIKMFNLYIEVDPENERNLLIETRDDFYAAGKTQDWTYKLARDKDIILEPTSVLVDKRYEYTYKSDEDYDNSKYEGKYGRVYGDVRVEVDNDFTQSDKKLEIEFSPTVLVNDRDSNRIIGRIYAEDIQEGIEQTEHNIRVLYWGGLLPSSPQWVFRYQQQQGQNQPSIAINTLQAFYPYAGHWDNPLTPSLDINFGITRELRYSANSYTGALQVTNANLFNLYHRNYFLEITDKDSKVMKAHFYLEPTDINKLDFRDQIVIDNAYWRLNKVMNYNPFNESLTKVELIKIKEPVTFSETHLELGKNGVIEDGLNKVKLPNVKQLKRSSNIFPDFAGSVQGRNNRVGEGSVKFIIQGDNNVVGGGTKNVTIFGNDNEVDAGLHNVQLINSNGVHIQESNTVYVNGKPQDNLEVLDGGEDTVRSLNGGTNIFTVDGGEDIVQTQFSDSAIYTIEGGQD
jgi:hypothetical protein